MHGAIRVTPVPTTATSQAVVGVFLESLRRMTSARAGVDPFRAPAACAAMESHPVYEGIAVSESERHVGYQNLVGQGLPDDARMHYACTCNANVRLARRGRSSASGWQALTGSPVPARPSLDLEIAHRDPVLLLSEARGDALVLLASSTEVWAQTQAQRRGASHDLLASPK